MSETNPSCLLYGPGDARFEDRPVPEIEDPNDVIIKIAYTGVCGSDVHFWTEGGFARKVSNQQPLVMGHEASGSIHKVGPAVSHLKPGDRVCIEPGFSCKSCNYCKSGRYNLCQKMKFAADPPATHGTLSRFFKIPQDFAYKLPDCISLEEAVLVEPLSVAIHGVRLADIRPGQNVIVQGAGAIGYLNAATALAYGAKKVVISDIKSEKLEFAKQNLKCHIFNPESDSTPEQEASRLKQEAGLDQGADVVLECTGVEISAQTGILSLAAGGVFVQIGLGKPMQSLPIHAMCEKEIVMKTCFRYGPGDFKIALGLLESGKVSVTSLISSVAPFEDAPVAWAKTMRGEGIKNLIRGELCGADAANPQDHAKYFEDPSWIIRDILEQIDVTRRFILEHFQDLEYCDNSACALETFKSGRIASMIGIEGGHQVGGSIATPSNVPNDVLRHVKQNRGIVMAVFLSRFLNMKHPEQATIHDVADHIFHIAEVCGWTCIGIGADFFGMSNVPIGLGGVSKYPSLREGNIEESAKAIQATGEKPVEEEYGGREWHKGYSTDPYMRRRGLEEAIKNRAKIEKHMFDLDGKGRPEILSS
ncbi:hypothetical protein FGRMN_5136 [Fusarium graminum]|nr:hypothetical protein FGRMN_5136 [Fusarium graminum]